VIEFLSRMLGQRKEASLDISRCSSYEHYLQYSETMEQEYKRRHQVERELVVPNSESFSLRGHCFVCRKKVDFQVDFSYSSPVAGVLVPNWREHLKCPHCNLNNRMRAAIHILNQECAVGQASHIYITEQWTPLFKVIRARYPNSVGSEYLGNSLPFGNVNQNGIRNESVTKLTFRPDAFDQILSFDVLEHVPEYIQGFAECFRCLRPGGTLLFSIPFTKEPTTIVRARANPDGSISHLLPAEYHGDPLSSQGCLCFYNFGWDVLEVPRRVGFQDVTALFFWSREYGYIGNGDQYLFTARKPA